MAINKLKVSFLGDIMCEEPFLRAATRSDGTYDFDSAFRGIRKICEKSDIVIGNLEMPFAGKEYGYTHKMYTFNTPDSFAETIKKLGISCVLTANNHCCDGGVDGLKRTINVLDRIGLSHTGTFKQKFENKPYFTQVKGVKIAVISCTADTNAVRTGYKATIDNVNLMQEQRIIPLDTSVKGKLKRILKNSVIGEENLLRIRKKMGRPAKKVTIDNNYQMEKVQSYMDRICEQIKAMKDKADIVFVCPHMGGQFNTIPGAFSEYAMEYLSKAGADAIIASHPHIVQKAELKNNIPCLYSIGNVSMSMSTLYILRDELPDYGVMVHFYLIDGKIDKVTYSLIIMDEKEDGYLMVRTAYDMYYESNLEERSQILLNAEKIVRRISMNDEIQIDSLREEFLLFSLKSKGER